MKRLHDDDQGLIPLIVGLGLAVLTFFGIGFVVGSWDDLTTFLRDGLTGTLLFIVGILALMGKFVVPRTWAVLIGLLCIFFGFVIAMGMV